MDRKALVLSVGGTFAALVQAFGFASIAGVVMLCANLVVILSSLVEYLRKDR